MRPEILFPYFKSVDSIKGVGPRLAGLMNKLAGPHVADLLYHLPSGVLKRIEIEKLDDRFLTQQIIGAFTVLSHQVSRNRRVPYKVTVELDGTKLTLIFFNGRESYLKQKLPVGEVRKISGKLESYGGEYQITHPSHILDPSEEADILQAEPIYPLTAGITNNVMNKTQKENLKNISSLPEWSDANLVQKREWPSWSEALLTAHRPQTENDLEPDNIARQRLAYDELLANQIALELVRLRMRKKAGRSFKGDGSLISKLEATLPFKLTNDQSLALSEIFGDMDAPFRMLRLVQGDVGSGKTAVAMIALAKCLEVGTQGAFMAPTEILARQHYDALLPLFSECGIEIAFLSGRLKGKKRDAVHDRLKSGEIQVLVGTHALFQKDVEFRDLGLAVIDEQHRFGVHQRLSLSSKGNGVDVLVMTATPIPRTLALTAYGDMDVSVIREKPPGRKPIVTKAIEIERLDQLADSLSRKISANERIYWVCPLVEESEVSDLAAAEERFRHLNSLYPDQVSLVHGKMKAEEKEEAMQSFKEGKTNILVATTVIEVGVDVPEATVMVIEHAERFGLAQLHQLRGRVGRGGYEGACLLLYAGPLGETQKARLKIMRETEDGFKISEEDLRLRGAGELLGTRQSGLPEFKVANLQEHGDLLQIARDDARTFLTKDPTLQSERGQAVRTLLYLFERDSAILNLQSG